MPVHLDTGRSVLREKLFFAVLRGKVTVPVFKFFISFEFLTIVNNIFTFHASTKGKYLASGVRIREGKHGLTRKCLDLKQKKN